MKSESSQATEKRGILLSGTPTVAKKSQTKISDHLELFIPSRQDNKRFMPKTNQVFYLLLLLLLLLLLPLINPYITLIYYVSQTNSLCHCFSLHGRQMLLISPSWTMKWTTQTS